MRTLDDGPRHGVQSVGESENDVRVGEQKTDSLHEPGLFGERKVQECDRRAHQTRRTTQSARRTMTAWDYLRAARVPSTLRPQAFGAWRIDRQSVKALCTAAPSSLVAAVAFMLNVGWESYTLLRRFSVAKMHLKDDTDIIMEDSVRELRQHLPIWLRARGRVLVTGLGLGCVVRGLLANPNVSHIDVIEMDKNILRVVGHEFASEQRVTLYHGDALTYHIPHRLPYDYAWHDICEREDQDEHLACLHARLLARFRHRARWQGAWKFPRLAKRLMRPTVRMIG